MALDGGKIRIDDSHDVEKLKEPINADECGLPGNEDVHGLSQFGEDLIEVNAHVDDTRGQHDSEDAVNDKVLLPRQDSRRIHRENPD